MFLTFRVPKSSARKILWSVLGGAALLVAFAAGCSSEVSDNGRPSSPTTAYIQPTPSFTGASTMTTEPSAAPSTSQPDASASESSDTPVRPGKVVAAFEDGDEGPFLVLAPMDEDQGDLEYATSQKDSLRKLDVTALPLSEVWKVDVSTDVLQACRPNTVRMVFKEYPSCAGSPDATPTSTDR
ncbi:hypothetical protein [Actinomadura mexicana]|uniref:Secreted protein n=1 Tax=Actinomadura mexicana TaxID=134959 RepID=A0A239D9K2_9ACTN|nr:hypothetical protein [Actinomadura mexicana]SNS28333.1 hypothetical protein SAMN06265355_11433 [Actinomadura mexicana]